jgi:transmembrane sensor
MGLPNPGAGSRPHRDATRWLVRLLDSDLRDPRRAEFQRWIAADPAHACAFREAERLWKLSEEAARHPDIKAASTRALHAVPVNALRLLCIWFATAAFVTAVLATMTGLALACAVPGWHRQPRRGLRRFDDGYRAERRR